MSTDINCLQCGNVAPEAVVTPESQAKAKKIRKTVVMYFAMVTVSTVAIYFLEHATLLNAFRTAVVAAVGKTLAANWVCSLCD